MNNQDENETLCENSVQQNNTVNQSINLLLSQSISNTHNNNCNNRKRKRMQYLIGTRIIKEFEGVPYEGTVISFNGTFYQILYSDKDCKDFSEAQVRQHLKNPPPQQKKRYRISGPRFTQTTLTGKILDEKDSKVFGHNFPCKNKNNCSIITFQNIGKQSQGRDSKKSRFVAKAFTASRASVALYTDTCLNETKLCDHDKFYSRMTKYAPLSYTMHSHNEIEGVDRSWEMYGGTAITMDKNGRSHKSENSGSGKDNTRLRRWTWF